MASKKNARNGFTLIELVIVITLISILSVTATSKYIAANKFNAFAYRDQMLASLHLMQHQAMQQTDKQRCHQMQVSAQQYQPSLSCNSSSRLFTKLSSKHQQALSFIIPATSAISILAKPSSTLTFDSWGRVSECAEQCIIEFKEQVSARICIESQGYMHAC